MMLGRFEEAQREMDRARELDPLSDPRFVDLLRRLKLGDELPRP